MHSETKLGNSIRRRTLLKSVAGMGALGALEHMPLFAAPQVVAGNKRKNLVIIVNMLGYNQHTYLPDGEDLDRSPLLSRLSVHYPKLTAFRNIMQPEIVRGHNGGRGILTCNTNQRNGPYISLDQLACEHLQQSTRYKSVHLGDKTIVWNKNSRAVPTLYEAGPEKCFEHLFGDTDTVQLEKKLHSLQAMREALPKKGRADYVASLAEHEQTLITDLEWAKKPIPDVTFDPKLNLTDHHGRGVLDPVEQQLELIRLGIKHRRGQVFVASPPFVDKTDYGLDLGYHELGHRAHLQKAIYDDMLKLEQHLFDCFANFLTDLQTDDLLDDTIVLFMGAFSSPGGHSREYLPTVLAGGGFKHQGVIECREGDSIRHPLSHLYVSILHQMGIDLDEFAGNRGNLDRLLA